MTDQVVGVKEFVDILNETLSFAYPEVVIEGEVASFKVNQGKWVFFDLKDDEATLGCFMPVYQLKVPLEDGMKVRVHGTPKLTKWGKFSFTAKSIELAGEGELRRAFEILKQKLSAMGIFDEDRKRPIPKIPARIGLITSAQSAAYSDFLKILNTRWSGVDVLVADVQVQGAPAPNQIVSAISYFDQLARPVDVLVLIRGGGSLEDLQAFNTEDVARAVAGSRTSIIVGVGHEIDVSLADFAADLRAATPTDAARLVVPDRNEMMSALNFQTQHIEMGLARLLRVLGTRIDRSVHLMERFARLEGQAQHINSLLHRLTQAEATKNLRIKQHLSTLSRVLSSYDPKATLARGYAIVKHDGRVLKSAAAVSTGEMLMIQLADGSLESKVTNERN